MSLAHLWPPGYQGQQRPAPGTPINPDSWQANGLYLCWPGWEGSGSLVEDLVSAQHLTVPVAAPQWLNTRLGQMAHRTASSTDTFIRTGMPGLAPPFTLSGIIVIDALATLYRFFSHDIGGNDGFRVMVNSSNVMQLTFMGVADYTLTGLSALAAGVPYAFAVTVTGNGGTRSAALCNLLTGQISTSSPAAVGTAGLGNRWSWPGTQWDTNCAACSCADMRVWRRSMSMAELVAIVSPYTRWDLFSPARRTRTYSGPAVTLLNPNPVLCSVSVPAVALVLALNPDPVLLTISAPAITRGATQNPDPALLAISVPAPALTYTLNPSPVECSISVPAPALTLDLNPGAVLSPISVPAPALTLELNPDPILVPISAPAIALSLELNPDPVEVLLSVPAPALTLELSTDPVEVPISVPDPALSLELNTDPVEVLLSAPTISMGVDLFPDPVECLISVPDVVLVVGAPPASWPRERRESEVTLEVGGAPSQIGLRGAPSNIADRVAAPPSQIGLRGAPSKTTNRIIGPG